jgi:two-component system, chemotaxis family, protein-glutamate methylesterase/glutaminase
MPVLPPIRVLVVDDSMVVRKVLSDVLASSPGIDLAGTASSGEIALVKIPQLKPDVVTLDIECPA